MKSSPPRDWKNLKIGDAIRVVAVPEGDQWHYDTSGSTFTIRVLWRLIKKKSVVRISHIDKETGYPWFAYRFRNGRGKMEHHTLTITENESWVHARRAKRPSGTSS